VVIGSKVSIVKKGERTPREITLVGGEESDTALGKISFHSPLGAALMGKRVGEQVVLKAPKGETVFKVKEIN
jgi:transcription elongation factor GreA